ncbi:MAG: CDP-diacylglycerol--glycerol-3-phosphate 3-phosphatidyltransferase [Acidobacteriota bacterium]|jgi:CDP-diacylglycerol--glycerol-3-phosphate 3-phosphatidyltransferase|nr:CDP-diacylglycerol--glycerol-3-phosphate 3-phosphatidyltransferase [Acidobacteriota bacterium]
MTKANIITIVRIIMVPFFLVILLTEMQNKEFIAFAIFVIAAVTDSLDGYVARKYNQVTDLGKFLDPMADKLLVSAALIALVYLQEVETWVAAIIILRELFITVFRFYYLVNNASFSASVPAKLKTTFQIVALAILIIYRKLPFSGILHLLGTAVLYIAVFLTVYSGVEYVIRLSRQPKK